jgi:hypothetical protein
VSFKSDERQIRASLGLHRGRRALGFAMLVVTGLVTLRVVVRDEQPVLVPPPGLEPPSAPTAPPQASAAPVRPRSLGTQSGHTQALVRAAVPVASSPERGAPPSTKRPAERVAPQHPSEGLAPPPPAVQPAQSRTAAEVDVAAAPGEPPAEPLPERVGPVARDGSDESVARDPAAAPDQPPAEPLPERAAPVAWDGSGESIARAIAAAKRAAVRNCFEHELKQQPKLTGTVVVELDLAAPDRVEALRVSDDLNRPEFTRCVTSAMQGLRFAALDEDISVRVPYTLSPVRR